MRVLWLVGLLGGLGCGGAASAPTSSSAPRMASFELGGYTLVGAEYWPYAGTADLDYPTDVLWGFYPVAGELVAGEDAPNKRSASPAAIACAERAFAELHAFLASDPPTLRAIVARGTVQGFVPRFYLWTNDYTAAATPFPPGLREPRLWYWKRKTPAPPKPPGYWKWESVVTQRGDCLTPAPAQITRYLADTLAELAPVTAR
ncbi:MAG: hypothetical protein NT062_21865 [Proteobacteria bacterium]|nr:hypothetical protein [Pseudomonadota bacterium]